MSAAPSSTANDLAALREAAETYARGADRRDKDLWRAVLAEDVELIGPGFAKTGLEPNLRSIDLLARLFTCTRHIVHDLTVTITDDEAEGETRCTAEHRMARPEGDLLMVWAIRYQDRWRREGGAWKLARRELIVDWEELRPVHDVGGAAGT
jgi:ketosteroid isomerase-like protein